MRKHGRQQKARQAMVERVVALSMYAARTVRVMRHQDVVLLRRLDGRVEVGVAAYFDGHEFQSPRVP